MRKRGGEACLEVRGSRDGSQDNQSCGSVVADEYGKGLVDSRRNCKVCCSYLERSLECIKSNKAGAFGKAAFLNQSDS